MNQPDSMYGVVVRVTLQGKLSHSITYQLYPIFKWQLLTSANWSIPLPFNQPDSIYGVVIRVLVQGNIFDPIHYSLFFKWQLLTSAHWAIPVPSYIVCKHVLRTI